MTLLLGDCIEQMRTLPDASVDMVLCDPPYGTTACKWDTVIPFEPMWREIKRVAKANAAVCLFGSEPFSSHLRMSNIKGFKYDWYLDKNNPTGNLLANRMPLRKIEIVSVFGAKSYYPQGLVPFNKVNKRGKTNQLMRPNRGDQFQKWTNYPTNLIPFVREYRDRFHPTQKPVALLEYLVRTYTLPGETVLDFTMGSGSTGVACVNTKRKFIGIELDASYFAIAEKRIADARAAQSDEVA